MRANTLIELYNEMQRAGIYFFDLPLQGTKAATIQNAAGAGVFLDGTAIDSLAEELCLLAHEYGHIQTGATHALDSPLDLVERHEYRADKYAVHRLLSKEELRAAAKKGYTEVWQLAEYFGVTEDFIRRAEYVFQCESDPD